MTKHNPNSQQSFDNHSVMILHHFFGNYNINSGKHHFNFQLVPRLFTVLFQISIFTRHIGCHRQILSSQKWFKQGIFNWQQPGWFRLPACHTGWNRLHSFLCGFKPRPPCQTGLSTVKRETFWQLKESSDISLKVSYMPLYKSLNSSIWHPVFEIEN